MQPSLAPKTPELVWFRGSDAVKFLNDLISQEIGTLPVGSVVRSFLLEPRGHVDFALWVLRGDEEVGLLTEDGRGHELVERLSRYRIRVDVEIEPESRPSALVLGRSSAAPDTWASEDGILLANISWSNLERELVVGKTPELPLIDPNEYTAARIAAGEPIYGIDFEEKTIPQELGPVANTISFNKGCFLGQELVARLDSRGGRVNRNLRILRFSEPVGAGATLRSPDREVGTVTTAVGDTGLSLVWREVEPGDTLDAGGVQVEVNEVPQKTAGSFTGS